MFFLEQQQLEEKQVTDYLQSLHHAVEGGITQMWTISALQMHPKGVIVCDEDATAELKVGKYRYFKDIEKV